jgi:hypothetical protein
MRKLNILKIMKYKSSIDPMIIKNFELHKKDKRDN